MSAAVSPALQSLDGGDVDAVPHATFERLQRNYDRVSAELRVAEEREAGLRREAQELHAALDAALRKDRESTSKLIDRSVQTVPPTAAPALLPQQLLAQRDQSLSGPTFNTPDSQTLRFPRFRHSVVANTAAEDAPDPALPLSPRPQGSVPAIAIGAGVAQSAARTPPAGGGSSARATKFDAALMSQQLRTVGAGFGGGATLGVDAGHSSEPTPRFAVPSLPSGSFRGVRSTPDGVVVVVPTPRRADANGVAPVPIAASGGGDTARRGRRRGQNHDADSDGGHTLDTSLEPPLRIVGGEDEGWREAEERLQRRAELLANLRVGPAELGDECGLCHVTHTVMALAEDDEVSAVLTSDFVAGGCTTAEWLVDAFVHYADQNERWLTRDEDMVLRATISALDADERGGSLLWHDADVKVGKPMATKPSGNVNEDEHGATKVDQGSTVAGDDDDEEERLESRSVRIDTVQLIVPEGPELAKRFTLDHGDGGRPASATVPPTPIGGTPQTTRQQLPSMAGEGLSVPRLHIAATASTPAAAAAASAGASAPRPHRTPAAPPTPVRAAAPSTTKGVAVACDVFQTPDALLVFVEAAPRDGPPRSTGRRVRAVCSPRCCGIHCGRQAGGGKFTLQGPADEGPRAAVIWTAEGPFPFSSLTFTAPTTTVAKFRRQLAALRQCCPHHATGVFRDGWHVIGNLVADHVRAALDTARSPMMTDR